MFIRVFGLFGDNFDGWLLLYSGGEEKREKQLTSLFSKKFMSCLVSLYFLSYQNL